MTALEAASRADQYEAARDRVSRLRTECYTHDQLAGLVLHLVNALAADDLFGAAVDSYLDDTRPQRREYPVCGECGQHGGHVLTCRLRAGDGLGATGDSVARPGSGWLAVRHEVTVGSQPDVIVNPVTHRVEHLRVAL